MLSITFYEKLGKVAPLLDSFFSKGLKTFGADIYQLFSMQPLMLCFLGVTTIIAHRDNSAILKIDWAMGNKIGML